MKSRYPLLPRIILGLSLAFGLVFLLRLGAGMLGLGPVPDAPVKGWMTLNYLERVYDLPKPEVAHALGLTDPEARRLSLDRISRAQGRPLAQVIADVEALRGRE
jgi:hypothetical protein